MNTPKEPTDLSIEKMDDKEKVVKKQQFENMVKSYLDSNPFLKSNNQNSELEIRFGTNTKLSRPISKIDFDNVVKQLLVSGFKTENIDGLQIMRISNEYIDRRSGQTRMSNIRAEIVGTDLIQEYCRTNSIQKILDMPSTTYDKMKFTQKTASRTKTGEIIQRLDMNDYNFRVSYQMEQDFNVQSQVARSIIDNWTESLKTFRFLNRVRFYHPDYPIFADLSIVKSSTKTNYVPIPKYTVQESNVFQNMETFEIELELDNSRVGKSSKFETVAELMKSIRSCIMIVLSGLQLTKFPISYPEKNTILQSYMRLIYGEEYRERYVRTKDFIGPSSFTLQLENIQPINEESNVVNIRQDYTVTDKADGERKLLYINAEGKIYMIDTNMNVIFTGTKTKDKTIFNSLLDGEHVKFDKRANVINLYAAFDIYYINGVSVRGFPFISSIGGEEEVKQGPIIKDTTPQPKIKCNTVEMVLKYRLPLLECFIDLIKPQSVLGDKEETRKSTEFRIRCKKFYNTSEKFNIFDGCSEILSKLNEASFEYNTDGLIFTPSYLAVGGTHIGGPPGPTFKSTWRYSLKWKPAEFNTIDFLVSIKKDKTGKDEIHYVMQEGRNLDGVQDVIQYKTLVLRCGFDEREDGYINPFQNIINDDLPSVSDVANEETYKPVPFQPTNPYDPNACYANIMLKEDGSKLFMLTEDEEYFEENMIVEFKYVITNDDGWKWVPLRVRYDKTAELNSGQKNYGNAYRVANSNWHSIHNPITEKMISTGENIPEQLLAEEVYYNRSNEETSTQAMRDFHNLYVKKKLIVGASNMGDSLIDYAVGKAGDISKWISAKLGFVFGIDISKDNIHNKLDGACARFLNANKKYPRLFRGLFVNGDSKLNIRDGTAFSTEKDKQIARAVFGVGPKDASLLGKGVYKQYGVAEQGFNVSSCQFALHYFFENKTTFHQFMQNLSECTKIQGHFVGTCYDGKTVFNLLRKKENGESITIMNGGRKIFEITKLYDQTGFPDEELSIGYPINVYQESINQVFREYLVNFEYLKRVAEDYGFVIITDEEAKGMGLNSGSGLFQELFTEMQDEISKSRNVASNYKKAPYMTAEEKQISFMNRYFVFKKVRNVNAKKMQEIITKQINYEENMGEENIRNLEKVVEENAPVSNIRKTKKRKVVLKNFVPETETEESEVEKTPKILLPPPPPPNVVEPEGELVPVETLAITEPKQKITIRVKKTKNV